MLVGLALASDLYYQGCYSWEERGDSKFYAQCARYFLQTGSFRWFELYPVFLSEGLGTEIAWTLFWHPLVASAFLKFGLADHPGHAVLLSSSMGWAAVSGLFCYFLCRKTNNILFGVVAGLTFALLPSARGFAATGGGESVSLFFLVLCAGMSFRYLDQPTRRNYLLLLGISVLGCFARPQNQFFLLALPVLPLFCAGGRRLKSIGLWLCALAVWQIAQKALAAGGDLGFSYGFSFLVGAKSFPDHSLFRQYFSDGFGLDILLEHSNELPGKLSKGWGVLKMYSTGWVWQVLLLLVLLINKRVRPVAILVFAVLFASLLLSGTGHMVPRYWTLLQGLSLFCLLMAFLPRLRFPSVFLLLLLVWNASLLEYFGREKPKLHPQEVPAEIRIRVPSGGLVACDLPARVVLSLNRRILLMPDSPRDLQEIRSEVREVSALVFAPGWQSRELEHWSKHFSEIEAKGYVRLESGDWKLFYLPEGSRVHSSFQESASP